MQTFNEIKKVIVGYSLNQRMNIQLGENFVNQELILSTTVKGNGWNTHVTKASCRQIGANWDRRSNSEFYSNKRTGRSSNRSDEVWLPLSNSGFKCSANRSKTTETGFGRTFPLSTRASPSRLTVSRARSNANAMSTGFSLKAKLQHSAAIFAFCPGDAHKARSKWCVCCGKTSSRGRNSRGDIVVARVLDLQEQQFSRSICFLSGQVASCFLLRILQSLQIKNFFRKFWHRNYLAQRHRCVHPVGHGNQQAWERGARYRHCGVLVA